MSRILVISLLCLVVGALAAPKKVDFTGVWTLDREKTSLGDSQLFMAKIDVTVKGDSLLTTRTYENEWGETYPFDENLKMDGSTHEITIYDMPRKAAAHRSENGENILFESTTTFYGDSGEIDLVTKEKWILDTNKKMLTIESENAWADEELKGVLYYKKSE